jgi:hypothetical protein
MNSLKTLTAAAFLTTSFTSIALGDGPFNDQAPPDSQRITSNVDAYVHAWTLGLRGADLNADGSVDGTDLELFFNSLEHPRSRADIDGNGTVDASDFAMFLSDWVSGNDGGDLNQDGGIDGTDIEEWYTCAASVTLDASAWNATGPIDP